MQPGDTLDGRYLLVDRLGRGGMGEVWRAEDGRLGRRVAVKVMTNGGHGGEAVERFHREASLSAGLRHPGIVVVHDFGEHDGLPFLVMELLDGTDLASVLREHPHGLPLERAVDLLVQAAHAVAHAHRQGVVHRDLKPANLFLQNDGTLKVCDFGLAYALEATMLSGSGKPMGSPPYMPPEQWGEERGDERSDVYALGCVAYGLLTGSPPFTATNFMGYMKKHTLEDPAPVHGVPEHVGDAVLTALEKEPERRPRSMDEFAARLVADDAPETLRPVRPLTIRSPGRTFAVKWQVKGNFQLLRTAPGADAVIAFDRSIGAHLVHDSEGRELWRLEEGIATPKVRHLGDDAVYLMEEGADDLLICRDLRNGEVRWTRKLSIRPPRGHQGNWTMSLIAPLQIRNRVHILEYAPKRKENPWQLVSLDARTGNVVHSHRLDIVRPESPGLEASASGRVLIYASVRREPPSFLKPVSVGFEAWTFDGAEMRSVSSAPLEVPRVVASTPDGALFLHERGVINAFRPVGSPLWSVQTGTERPVEAAVADGTLVFGPTGSGGLRALFAATGSPRWESGQDALAGAVVAGRGATVYAKMRDPAESRGAATHHLAAFSAVDGTVLGRSEAGVLTWAVNDAAVFTVMGDGSLRALAHAR